MRPTRPSLYHLEPAIRDRATGPLRDRAREKVETPGTRGKIGFQLPFHAQVQICARTGPRKIPRLFALGLAQALLQRSQRTLQFCQNATHLGKSLVGRPVRLDVAEREQDFHPRHVARSIGLLHFVPKRGNGRASIGPQIWMQSPDESAIKLLYARVDR